MFGGIAAETSKLKVAGATLDKAFKSLKTKDQYLSRDLVEKFYKKALSKEELESTKSQRRLLFIYTVAIVVFLFTETFYFGTTPYIFAFAAYMTLPFMPESLRRGFRPSKADVMLFLGPCMIFPLESAFTLLENDWESINIFYKVHSIAYLITSINAASIAINLFVKLDPDLSKKLKRSTES